MTLLRRHGATDEGEQGFTLIELLVVIIIVGILAAIALPVFLSQRQKGYDAQSKSDLRNLANFEEIYLNDFGQYGSITGVRDNEPQIQISHGDVLSVVAYDGVNGYCLSAHNPSSPNTWFYDSRGGGLQPRGTTACPDTTTGADGGSLTG